MYFYKINCLQGVAGGIFNAYCWTHATFTLPRLAGDPHPGVGPEPGRDGDQEQVLHGWYQWVGMALFGQSFTFYIGHFLWKSCEGRRVERLVSGEQIYIYWQFQFQSLGVGSNCCSIIANCLITFF